MSTITSGAGPSNSIYKGAQELRLAAASRKPPKLNITERRALRSVRDSNILGLRSRAPGLIVRNTLGWLRFFGGPAPTHIWRGRALDVWRFDFTVRCAIGRTRR